MSPAGLTLGPPGVYHAQAPEAPVYQAARLDVAGFVGVSPRGPVDQPTPVESWSDYQWQFGGYDGPGLLPWAVRTFFAQGGRRVYVCRVSPLPRAPAPEALAATARHQLLLAGDDGTWCPLGLRAANEGTWGAGLVITLRFDVVARYAAEAGPAGLVLPTGTTVDAQTLLRVHDESPRPGRLRWVDHVGSVTYGPLRRTVAVLDRTVPPGPVRVEVVTATAEVRDTAADLPRVETFAGLRLRAGHPRWLARVLTEESRMIDPADPWPDRVLPPDTLLTDVRSTLEAPGVDRWQSIGRGSLFGDVPAELLPLDGPEHDGPPTPGVDAMALVPEVALVAVPDLFWDYTMSPATSEQTTPYRPDAWERCRPTELPLSYPSLAQPALRLDGRANIEEIMLRQQRLVDLAERQCRFVALLDVPEHLPLAAVARWRSRFDSSYAAAYHPWLGIVAESLAGGGAVCQLVPPSAFAAGIIAERERRLGLPYGPANELAAEAVVAADPVTDVDHKALHALAVDVFLAERDGFRLTAGRTLASDSNYRQLSVRRLMTMLRLMLHEQSQWLVFEPHTTDLRGQLRDALVALLRDLYRGGAFVGDTEDQAFFVRCDDTMNPGWSEDLGRLVAEVGVAPVSPLEYLVLRVSQDTDGALRVAE